MSVYLRTVPQAGLGVVTVNVFIKPDKNYNCTDCISVRPDQCATTYSAISLTLRGSPVVAVELQL